MQSEMISAPSRDTVIVLRNIGMERWRQNEKWGEQHHPDGTNLDWKPTADLLREQCDQRHKSGKGTWLDILFEEVYEVAAEPDPVKLRKELVQVAAVAAAWVEDIDSRGKS